MASTVIATTVFTVLATVYTAVAVVHRGGQVVCAEAARRRLARRARPTEPPDPAPAVDLIVPCYNEAPATLDACLTAIVKQNYPGTIEIYVVDDGSRCVTELSEVYRRFRDVPGFHVITIAENRGKRYAQAEGLRYAHGDLVVTVDSDTIIDPDGVRALVCALADPGVGAAVGQMSAANATATWLTRLVDMRYWIDCNQEKMAQSYFGSVLCCSGVFAIYRRSVLDGLLDDYLRFTVRGRNCNYGEDRHLTTLILDVGLATTYVPLARCVTVVPTHLRAYLRQQLRWNRSVYLELVDVVRALRGRRRLVGIDAVMTAVSPLLLGFTTLAGLVTVGATTALPQWGMSLLGGAAVAHCLYAVWRTRNVRFLTFICYGLIYMLLLVPVRVKALFTIGDNRWGTR